MTATAVVRGHGADDDDDGTLLERLRQGEVDAYAELWRRHLASAYRIAHRYRGRASAEDIVGEASLRVFDRIQAGDGPSSNFRGYFLTVVKNVALDHGKGDLRLVPTDSEGLEACATPIAPYDAAARVDQDLVRTAFGRLSTRDQQVLWHTAVLGAPAAVIGVRLGVSANAVSAAAVRAREALRAAYLDAHADKAVERTRSMECRWVLSQMGRHVRGKLRGNRRARIERHLQHCTHAQVLASELTEINLNLPALMVPLIFVAGAGGSAAWCSGALAAGHHGSVPQSVPVDQPGSALAGVGASATGLITKAAVVITAAALGAGLTNTAGIGSLTIPSAKAHSAGDMLRFLPPAESLGDGMPEQPGHEDGSAPTVTNQGNAATVDDQPIATAADPAPTAVAVSAESANASDLAPAPSPSTTNQAVSTNGSSTTTTNSTGSGTAKAKKTPQLPATTPLPADTRPTSPEPAATSSVPPGQVKKGAADPATSTDACKNDWSHARACRTDASP